MVLFAFGRKGEMMKKYLRYNIVNIASLLFLINAVSALSLITYLLAWELLAITGLVLAVMVILLLLLSCAISMGNKAIYEENSTNCKYSPLNHKFYSNISTNVWSWVFTSASKILKVLNGVNEKQQVTEHNDTTGNHSFHNDTLSQEQPNANKTKIYIIY